MSLFNELKRRNVFRVAAAYIIVAWLLLQVSDTLVPALHLPEWFLSGVAFVLILGFPVAMIFAWAFEMTPEGLKREHEVDRSRSTTPQTSRKLDYLIIGVLVVALGYFTYDKFVLDASRDAGVIEATTQDATIKLETQQEESIKPEKSIAVLPFVNMSGDEENEYFSDGLTEELINALAKIEDLKVAGRTSSFAFKGQNTDLREIGRQLNVAHLLEGSVRKAANRIRITTQLVKVEDGYHLWSETYDRELDDIFAIQEEIARKVVAMLEITLLGEPGSRLVVTSTSSALAYERYLEGRYVFLRGTDDLSAHEEARVLFKSSLELDPDFLLARYGLFRILDYEYRQGLLPYEEGAKRLAEMAENLVRLGPDLAESHLALGRARSAVLDIRGAMSAVQKALSLSPGSAEALSWSAIINVALNQREAALAAAEKALQRDPLGLIALLQAAEVYAWSGKCDALRQVSERAFRIKSTLARFNWLMGTCKLLHENNPQAAAGLFNDESLIWFKKTGLAIAYNQLGRHDEARQQLDGLRERMGESASYQYSQIYAQWGDFDQAFEWLQHAFEIRDAGLILMYSDHYFDPLREDPRFDRFIERWLQYSDS